ncbi:hypothetical protein Tco_1237115 [Tanacetum coccineum]
MLREVMKYEDIRPIFEQVWDQTQSFMPMDSEKESKEKVAERMKERPQRLEKTRSKGRRPRMVQKNSHSWRDIRFYEIHKADRNYKTYKFFSKMLNDFYIDDLIVLYRLFNEKYASTRPWFNDLMLWGDMKIMFDLDENGEIWKNQNIEKKYPLPQDTLTRMLRWKLYVNYEILEMACELLKFIKSQIH